MSRMALPAAGLLALAGLLAGCNHVQSQVAAPIEVIELGDTGAALAADAPIIRPDIHRVRAGETLGEIALLYGLDYNDIAIWNGIANPNRVEIGQVLNLTPPSNMPEITPLAPVQAQEAIALGEPLAAPATAEPQPARVAPAPAQVTRAQIGIGQQDGTAVNEVSEPQALLLPYSDEAYRRLQQQAGGAQQANLVVSQQQAGGAAPQNRRERNGLVWSWPTNGKVTERFSASSQGIRIAGPQGWPIYASADGRVIYAGTGLKGYGQLVIIKHANEYLTTYAHNHRILVAEGEQVKRGQQIAEMGKSGAEKVGLHFAVRRGSQSYNPRQFLPNAP